MNVLLLEPDTKLANTYQKALASAGYKCLVVNNAQQAIHVSDTQKPDLVLLELQLSGHNGIEFVYEFRSYPEWQNVPILVLTMVPPHALNLTAELMKDCNIVGCLYKPATNLKQLLAAVEELI